MFGWAAGDVGCCVYICLDEYHLMETTPRNITTDIIKLIRSLGIETNPVYLPFTQISDRYLPKHCLSNCEAENHYTGDPIVYGWVIWEKPEEKLIEAEFHGVIQRGFALIDITPRTDGEAEVLFAVDVERKARRINNTTWETWINHISRNGILEPTTLSKLNMNYCDKLF